MKKNYQRLINGLILAVLVLSLFCVSSVTYAASNVTGSMINSISKIDLPSGGTGKQAIENTTTAIIGRAIAAFLSLFGIIFLILTVYGGYKWMMAAGREEEVKSAKDIIRAAVIGLVIVLMSYAITYFVVTSIQSAAIK